MFKRARYIQEMRAHGFTRVEIKGVLRRLDAGDRAGVEAFWKDCWLAAQKRAEPKSSKWLRPDAYLNAG